MKVSSLTDTGRARTNNEDSLLADPPLLAVADGMGGHEGGEVASAIAVEIVQGFKPHLEGLSGRDAADKLAEAFQEANRAVIAKGEETAELRGMGTTLTAAWVSDGKVALAHVGDSRAYLLRGQTLQQLTEDQNVAQEWVRRGRLTQEEAASSPHRHIVLQAIGAEAEGLDVDVAAADIRAGDRLILASDGLFGMLKTNDAMRDILLAHPDNDEACRALIDAANAAGGADNISVVILEMPADPNAPAADEDEEVVIDRGPRPAPAAAATSAPKEPREPKQRRLGRMPFVIGGAILLGALMIFLLIRPSGASYVVSTRDGVVVVLDGKMGDEDSDASGEVVQRFGDEHLDEFSAPVQRELRRGISVETLDEARDVVGDLPRQLGPKDTPTPEPTASTSPKPGASPKASPKPTPTP